MEILLAAVVAAAVSGAVVLLALRSRLPHAAGTAARVRGGHPDDRAAGTPASGDSTARPDGGSRSSSEGEPASSEGEPAARALAESPAGAPPSLEQSDPAGEEPAGDGAGPRGRAGAGTSKPPASRAQVADGARGAALRHDVIEADLRARREELARLEERVRAKEQAVDLRLRDIDQREQTLEDRKRNLDQNAGRLKQAKREQVRELERVAGLSAGQAKQVLMRELEDEVRHDSARLIRQVEEETRHDADRRARSILATCMQRVAGGHAIETTVSVVELTSDELKGRIIGREGRNIRALETLTGIDFIIDDTPGAVLLSGFDGVRREIARIALERLLQDGRIHPARIEEAYGQAKSEIERRIVEVGEQAVFEANVGSLHPELTKVLGRLHFRTSSGQNVLAHSIECARLGSMLAAELGASTRTAARAALLHDIGKAISHETEGPHALVGGQLARRYEESEAVAHAMESHHNEVEPQTIEAVIVQIADTTSGARPGARGESLERYVSRLHELEALATRHAGVDKVYAMHAGREIRVIVRPEDIDDDSAALLSRTIAREVEKELEYPGQIKVTVIRESRTTDYAK